MSIIIVKIHEVVVGKPSPWSLYNQEGNLLLGAGEIVLDEEHRDSLLAEGACRELSAGDNDSKESVPNTKETPADKTKMAATEKLYTFDDMNLKVEDKLQLETPTQFTRERFSVKVIGFLREFSLLVTIPIAPNGLRLPLMEKEKIIMRYFSGQNAFGFASNIERIIKIPYEYMHLSIPKNVQGIMVRKAPRIKTHIIASVNRSESGVEDPVSGIISDISATGLSLDSKEPLGNKGDIVDIAFRVQLHNIDAQLLVKGVIRAVLNCDIADKSKPALVHHGIELKDLTQSDSVTLQSMIYQQIVENPHKLV